MLRASRSLGFAQLLLGVALFGLIPSAVFALRTGRLVVLEIAFLAAAAFLIRSRPARYAALWLVLGFAACYNASAMSTCWRALLALLAVEGVAAAFAPAELPALLATWRWLTVAHTSYMLLQAAGVDPLFRAFGDARGVYVAGWLDNTTLAGAYAAMTLPLFATGRWRLWLAPTLLAVAATHSLGACLVAATLLLWTARATWRWSRVECLLTAVAALLAVNAVRPLGAKLDLEHGIRLRVWLQTAQLYLLPLTAHGVSLARRAWMLLAGWGPGQYAAAFYGVVTARPIGNGLDWKVAHFDGLQLLFEQGAVGVALWWAAIRGWLAAALATAPLFPIAQIAVGWLLVSCYSFPAHLAYFAPAAIVCAGLCEAAKRGRFAAPEAA